MCFLLLEDEGLFGVFVNIVGGVVGGDSFEVDIVVGEGVWLMLMIVVVEKVYCVLGVVVWFNIVLKVDVGVCLCWLL